MAHDNPLRIPEPLRHDAEEIFKLTGPFSAAHLDAEYGGLVRTLIAKLARTRPSPLARGVLRIWAGAAIYAVGSVNFLVDPTQRPHLTGDQLSELTGVPKRTLANKAKRMGLYAHEGAEGDLIILRDLATAAMCHAIVPFGYRGRRGELWYARVLPPHRSPVARSTSSSRRRTSCWSLAYTSGRRTSAERSPMPRSKLASTPTSAT